jgi:hypothetical protein
MIKRIFIIGSLLVLTYSCIKPYACECEYVYTSPVQKSHILVYASKHNKDEACTKQNKDTSVVCHVKE